MVQTRQNIIVTITIMVLVSPLSVVTPAFPAGVVCSCICTTRLGIGTGFLRRRCLANHLHEGVNCRERSELARGETLALRIQRKAKRIFKKGKANIRDARQMVVYAGFAKYANIRNWFKRHVLLYVSIKRLRKKISNYDKQLKGGLLCGTT